MYFVSDLFTPYTRGFFSPFLHSTCTLSIYISYSGLEGGSPIFKQIKMFYFFDIYVFIIQDFYLLWSCFPDMFCTNVYIRPAPFSFANTHGISVDFFS